MHQIKRDNPPDASAKAGLPQINRDRTVFTPTPPPPLPGTRSMIFAAASCRRMTAEPTDK